MQIQDLIKCLESLAPPVYQEPYDNAGLLTGRPDREVTNALLTLDTTEAVVGEAVEKGCNLIIAHHPIIFKGLKRLNGNNYVERTVIKAIRNDIAIYAAHTNLDNVQAGVNNMICDRLGLVNRQILSPAPGTLKKLFTFAPHADAERVRRALFEAGAGHIGNYSEASFNAEGSGTFKGAAGTRPYVGTPGSRHEEPETKIEVIFPKHLEKQMVKALLKAHPYEEAAYDIIALDNTGRGVGGGMTGELKEAVEEPVFLEHIKKQMRTGCIRYTNLLGKPLRKVAVCGGAGSFLLRHAIAAGAGMFVSADFKYHEFFDADNQIVIADIGHFESEQFTINIFYNILTEKFPNFAPLISNVHTNPINYLH